MAAVDCFKNRREDFARRANEAYGGKVILVVNTASKCGNTPQYEGLERLYQEYGDEGLVVLGFPSNDFLGQEPGTPAEIRAFCSAEYGVSFPLFDCHRSLGAIPQTGTQSSTRPCQISK